MRKNTFLWLEHVAVAIIVIAFFVISYCGFYMGDDLSMAHGSTPTTVGKRIGEISSIFDVFKLTWWWYFHLGGRFFSVAAQFFFCGLLGNKLWFDIVNTLFFVLLIMTGGRLINNGKEKNVLYIILLFALLFWLLCPMPNETLFWVAGSTTHLWGNTLAFAFLLFFLKYKDDNFSVVGKVGLLVLSIIFAAEFIPCASISGAFAVYYVFHIKKFKKNVVPFVVGFVVGSVLLLFAPGNFGRAELAGISFLGNMRNFLCHPILEIKKYKVLWVFLVVLVLGWIKNKKAINSWMKGNSVLLLALGWSVIAFSIVFRPERRALFFPETLALVLFLKFLFDNYQVLGIRILDGVMGNNRFSIRNPIISILFVIFLVDSAFAITETKKQCDNNNRLLNEIKDSGGIVALDRVISLHRMAYVADFPKWTWEPLAERFGLDSVHVYPYFCQNMHYNQGLPWDNVYIDQEKEDLFGKYVRLIVRIKTEELQASDNHVTFTIDYTRPRKWYKSWLDEWRNYRYDRTEIVKRDNPDACFDSFGSYCYYIIWYKRENVKGLKSVKYTIE